MRDKRYNDARALLGLLNYKLKIDIKVECLANLLIENNILLEEEVQIIHSDSFRRGYRDDVVEVGQGKSDNTYCNYFEEEDRSILRLNTSRNSVLDLLPEAFYVPTSLEEPPKEDLTPREIAENERKRKAELAETIKSAKLFFIPFEVEYNRSRVTIEQEELRLLKSHYSLLEEFWGSASDISKAWKRYYSVLHLCHHVVGDEANTQHLIQHVLGKEVSLDFYTEEISTLPEELHVSMGTYVLGHNFTVDNVLFEYALMCKVTVKGLAKDEYYQFTTPDTPAHRLLQEIAKYYFPLDTEVVFEYKLSDAERLFSFGGEKGTSILGLSILNDA